jgi:hypothetical protein
MILSTHALPEREQRPGRASLHLSAAPSSRNKKKTTKIGRGRELPRCQSTSSSRPATRPGTTYAFLPCVMSTSGRIHGEFLRLLYIPALMLSPGAGLNTTVLPLATEGRHRLRQRRRGRTPRSSLCRHPLHPSPDLDAFHLPFIWCTLVTHLSRSA